MTLTEERKKLIEAACKKIFDELEESVTHLKDLGTPQISDDYDKIHAKLLTVTQIESELGYFYRSVIAVKHEVDVSKARAKARLEDAAMEATQKPSFKNPLASYSTRPETDAKLRSLTIEETYDLRVWEILSMDVQYLLQVVQSYQQDANRQRRDIDTRLKILSLRF